MTGWIQAHPLPALLGWLLLWATLWPLAHLGGNDEVTVWFVFIFVLLNARLLDALLSRRQRSRWAQFGWWMAGLVGTTAVAILPTAFLLNVACGTLAAGSALSRTLTTARLCYEGSLMTSSLFPVVLLTALLLIAITLFYIGRAIWHIARR